MSQQKQYPEIDAYLAAQPEKNRQPLEEIRRIIRNALPDAEEAISYQMPSFKLNGVVAWYAPSKNHYAIYMPPKYLVRFREQLAQYSQTKSAIHFDYNKPVPEALITEMVLAAARENLLNKTAKDAAKSTKKAKK
jgi:uncharacterized protein YdhG (YjbR/CyaY superfamily)